MSGDNDSESEEDKGIPKEEEVGNWHVTSRQYAIALMQKLEVHIGKLQLFFVGSLAVYSFVMLVSDFIRGTSTTKSPPGTRSREHAQTEAERYKLRLDLYSNTSDEEFLKSPEGTILREEVNRWEANMKTRWDLTGQGTDKITADNFTVQSDVEFCLWKLFRAIDHNKTNRITWEIFLAYLFDSVMKGRAGTISQDDIRPYVLIHKESSASLSRIQTMSHNVATSTLRTHIRNKDVDSIKILDDVSFHVLKSHAISPKQGALVDFLVIEKEDLFITATADTFVRVYESKTAQVRTKRKCAVTATKLVWNHKTRHLYVGCRNGELQVWDIFATKTQYKEVSEPVVIAMCTPHRDAITGVLFLPYAGDVVTCSLDATIKCLSLKTHKTLKTLSGHKRGVTGMIYCHQYNLLVSCGHEYTPLAWAINVPNSKPFILRDGSKPHSYRIVGIVQVPSTPQCLSLDEAGMLKVWDCRTLRCVQTLLCEPGASKSEIKTKKWTSMTFHAGTKQIITSSGRRIYVFQYNMQGKSLDPKTATDFPISTAQYIPSLKSFLTASRRELRVWDIVTGRILLTFDELFTDDIRVLHVTQEDSKCYMGCFDGRLAAINTSTGNTISQTVLPSSCEITHIAMVPGTPFIFCLTTDGVTTVVSHIEGIFNVGPFLTTGGRATRMSAKSLCLYPEMGVILFGEGQNIVSVWDTNPTVNGIASQWRKLAECTSSPLTSEVTCVIPLKPYPCFAVSDCSGGLHTWTLSGPNVAHPYTCMSRWVNNHSTSTRYTPSVVLMAFHSELALLYTADDLGIINLYSIKEGIETHVGSGGRHGAMTPDVGMRGLRRPSAGSMPCTSAKLLHTWKAHEEGVTALQIVDSPVCVMTAGRDCYVVLWTMWGERVTSLAKSQLPGLYQLDTTKHNLYNDVPWPINPAAQMREMGMSRRFSSFKMINKSSILAKEGASDEEEEEEDGVSLYQVLQTNAAEKKKTDAEAPPDTSGAAKPNEGEVVDKGYNFSKMVQQYEVFYKTGKQIMLLLKKEEKNVIKKEEVEEAETEEEEAEVENEEESCSDTELQDSEPSTTPLAAKVKKRMKFRFFQTHLLAKAPPAAVAFRPRQQQRPEEDYQRENVLPPTSPSMEALPSSMKEIITDGFKWSKYIQKTSRKAVVSQRLVRRPKPQQTFTQCTPLSGEIMSHGICPDIRTRTKCWIRQSSPMKILHTNKRQGVLLPQIKVVRGKTNYPKRAKFEASEYSPTWSGWNASGDGMAVRKLNGKPYSKSWLVS